MTHVLRWGRSAYETNAVLDLERSGTESMGFRWHFAPGGSPPPELERAEVLVIPSAVRVDAEVLALFGGRLVIATTSGYDHIDLDACADRGVSVVRLPEARRDAVVEHALSEMIALLRRLPILNLRAREGTWARGQLPGLAPIALAGAPVAVIGLGVIGRRVAEVLCALGAQVLGVDPAGVPLEVEPTELEDALSRARAVTLHCSLTPSSRGLLSKARLALLSPEAVVVNTARGEVLEVEAAVEQVRTGQLRGVAVDVFPVEPYPRLAAGVAIPNVRFTPHSAGYTEGMGERVAAGVMRALRAFEQGEELPHRVV
ncbi:MAG: hydroxyacid dehydrogenase [Deltaproteobacteria bacterium]|nr:hydroxyacid dehydrogenase [Deltaproteobacteria bacterium]MBW2254697.1 hydroxyacid dehydrogenase [Deltaproteobacteria bacterium]